LRQVGQHRFGSGGVAVGFLVDVARVELDVEHVDLVVAGLHLPVRTDEEAAVGAFAGFVGADGDRADQEGDAELGGEFAELFEAGVGRLGGGFLPRGARLAVQQGGHFRGGDQFGALRGGLPD
jgi:hypothetical protein